MAASSLFYYFNFYFSILLSVSFSLPIDAGKKNKYYNMAKKIKLPQLEKKNYRRFILSLQNILPCRHCRDNMKKNLKKLPLTMRDMKNRHTFSLWVYKFHEQVNCMLNKKSVLSYAAVRERYEHFRSRCTENRKKRSTRRKICIKRRKTRKKREKGCTKPLYGKKSKCVLKIIPHDQKTKSISIDKRCIKTR